MEQKTEQITINPTDFSNQLTTMYNAFKNSIDTGPKGLVKDVGLNQLKSFDEIIKKYSKNKSDLFKLKNSLVAFETDFNDVQQFPQFIHAFSEKIGEYKKNPFGIFSREINTLIKEIDNAMGLDKNTQDVLQTKMAPVYNNLLEKIDKKNQWNFKKNKISKATFLAVDKELTELRVCYEALNKAPKLEFRKFEQDCVRILDSMVLKEPSLLEHRSWFIKFLNFIGSCLGFKKETNTEKQIATMKATLFAEKPTFSIEQKNNQTTTTLDLL